VLPEANHIMPPTPVVAVGVQRIFEKQKVKRALPI